MPSTPEFITSHAALKATFHRAFTLLTPPAFPASSPSPFSTNGSTFSRNPAMAQAPQRQSSDSALLFDAFCRAFVCVARSHRAPPELIPLALHAVVIARVKALSISGDAESKPRVSAFLSAMHASVPQRVGSGGGRADAGRDDVGADKAVHRAALLSKLRRDAFLLCAHSHMPPPASVSSPQSSAARNGNAEYSVMPTAAVPNPLLHLFNAIEAIKEDSADTM